MPNHVHFICHLLENTQTEKSVLHLNETVAQPFQAERKSDSKLLQSIKDVMVILAI